MKDITLGDTYGEILKMFDDNDFSTVILSSCEKMLLMMAMVGLIIMG